MRSLFLIKFISICSGHIDAHAISDFVFHIEGLKLDHTRRITIQIFCWSILRRPLYTFFLKYEWQQWVKLWMTTQMSSVLSMPLITTVLVELLMFRFVYLGAGPLGNHSVLNHFLPQTLRLTRNERLNEKWARANGQIISGTWLFKYKLFQAIHQIIVLRRLHFNVSSLISTSYFADSSWIMIHDSWFMMIFQWQRTAL